VTYELTHGSRLQLITEIINRSEGLIPIQDGWHPYFTLGKKIDDLQIEFQSKTMVQFDDEMIPTGKLIAFKEFCSLKKLGDTTFDNCFELNFAECQPLCVLRNKDRKIEVQISPDKSYPYLQLYIPPDRNSIAIENLSSVPDAFNNKMGERVLESGDSAIFKTSYKLTLLD
jgi:aldose 1-epimerase